MHHIDANENLRRQVPNEEFARMRKWIAAVVLAVAWFGRGDAQTVIKGHHLGETAAEFLSAEPEIRAHLMNCDAHKHVITTEEVDASSEMHVRLLATQMAILNGTPSNVPSRAEFRAMVANGKAFSVEMPDRMDNLTCVRQMTALEMNGSKDFGKTAADDTEVWEFANGKLVEMRFKLPGSTFEELVADMSKRLNTKALVSHPPMQNAMGATWADDVALWLTPDMHADLHESHNPAKPSIKLEVETRAKYDREVIEAKHAPSPLD